MKTDKLPNNNPNSKKSTPYGEMVPTSFSWISPDAQREKAERLENLGLHDEDFSAK